MAEADFDASQQPTFDLFSHILQKGFQAGSVIGVIAAPIIGLYRRKFDSSLLSSPAYGSILMTVVAGGLGAVKYRGMDQEGLEDRVYRLHYNEGQNRTDNFAQVGAIAGLAASVAFSSRQPITLLGGAALGAAAGVFAHAATAPKDLKTASKMVHELKTA